MQTNTAIIRIKRTHRDNEELPESVIRSRKLNKRDRSELRKQKRIFTEV